MNLNYLTFNQDYSGIGIATNKGIRIYHTEPFMTSYVNQEGDIGLMEMLYMTTLVAIVPSPRRLRIMNMKVSKTSPLARSRSKISPVGRHDLFM